MSKTPTKITVTYNDSVQTYEADEVLVTLMNPKQDSSPDSVVCDAKIAGTPPTGVGVFSALASMVAFANYNKDLLLGWQRDYVEAAAFILKTRLDSINCPVHENDNPLN